MAFIFSYLLLKIYTIQNNCTLLFQYSACWFTQIRNLILDSRDRIVHVKQLIFTIGFIVQKRGGTEKLNNIFKLNKVTRNPNGSKKFKCIYPIGIWIAYLCSKLRDHIGQCHLCGGFCEQEFCQCTKYNWAAKVKYSPAMLAEN